MLTLQQWHFGDMQGMVAFWGQRDLGAGGTLVASGATGGTLGCSGIRGGGTWVAVWGQAGSRWLWAEVGVVWWHLGTLWCHWGLALKDTLGVF